MTVAELIKRLQECPQDSLVHFWDNGSEVYVTSAVSLQGFEDMFGGQQPASVCLF